MYLSFTWEKTKKATESPQCHSEEEEQLSPMSVMDFPSGEEDEEEEADDPASPSFHHSLAKLERRHLILVYFFLKPCEESRVAVAAILFGLRFQGTSRLPLGSPYHI